MPPIWGGQLIPCSVMYTLAPLVMSGASGKARCGRGIEEHGEADAN